MFSSLRHKWPQPILAFLFQTIWLSCLYPLVILFRCRFSGLDVGFPVQMQVILFRCKLSCLDVGYPVQMLITLFRCRFSCLDPLVFLFRPFGFPVQTLWVSCLDPLVFLLQSYLTFQSFDFERTWLKLFQKRIMATKLDIDVFIFGVSKSKV